MLSCRLAHAVPPAAGAQRFAPRGRESKPDDVSWADVFTKYACYQGQASMRGAALRLMSRSICAEAEACRK